MSQLKLTATGDLDRSSGGFERITGLQSSAQHVTVRFQLFRGEVPWDLTMGIPYDYVLDPRTSDALVEAVFTDVALGTPGIVAVTEMSLRRDPATRRGTIDWRGTGSEEDGRRRVPLHDTFGLRLPG